jgi:hypothetical protein
MLPEAATPEDNAAILRYGVDLYHRGRALASKAGEAALASLDREHRAREQALRAEHGERERALAAAHDAAQRGLQQELAATRAAADAAATEVRLAATRSAEAAHTAVAARMEALATDLHEARGTLNRYQAEQAEAILDAASKARAEAHGELRPRVAALEAELVAARATMGAAAAAEVAQLAARFDRVFSPQAASAAKGRLGEATLASLLERLFPDAELEDCSAAPGCGDAILTVARAGRGYRLMVESKNVAKVRSDDLAKFARDCASSAAKVDGAVFAALTAESIPRLGAHAFRLEAGLPALYVTAVAANPEVLRLGIEALLFAAQARPDPAAPVPPEDWADVREAVSTAFGVLSRQATRARALRESAAAVIEAVAAFEGEASIAVAAIDALWRSRPSLKRPLPEAAPVSTDPVAAACLSVRRFVDEHRRDPTRAEVLKVCKVPDSVLRRVGGARPLIASAKKLVL